MGTQNVSLSHARDKTKNIFLYSFTELKAYSLSRHIYKTLLILVRMHSMQDARHMNFVIDLVHRRVCFSVVEHRSAESKRSEVRFLMETQNFFYIPRS